MKKGQLSVQTENILPIIKKFLYSDQEIFLRELVSNAVDATQKIKMLAKSGTYDEELGSLKIQIKIDKDKKTIHVIDRGIGMTEEEIEKYINEIAFSSAGEFVEKFKDVEDKSQIIGHFGLGFYSAFMVSKKVDIITKSYQKDAKAVKWECSGNTEFEIKQNNKKDRGTEIVLHVTKEGEEYLEEDRINHLLEKYCRFMPIEIEFNGKVINNKEPIWLKQPSDLTSQDYKDFYNQLYPFSPSPLFWIHLNVDYPFNLTGILYFPKITSNIEVQRNKIQLYSNQVYVTDTVQDIIPDFLTLLHGVIDSPDIPLNVSRSYLQSDSNVKKISSYIVRKVADKLQEEFINDRKDFESKWEDIGIFVKYGMLSDEKFREKAKSFTLIKNTEGNYYTVDEYKEHVKGTQSNKDKKVIFLYANNPDAQHTYIEAAQARNYDVLLFDNPIDTHFIQMMEQQYEDIDIKGVDSDTIDNLIEKEEKLESALSEDQQKNLKELFEQVADKERFKIEMATMSPNDPPVVITQAEFEKRMKDMSAMGGMMGMGNLPDNFVAKINTNHKLANKILLNTNDEQRKEMAKQAFDLARLSKNLLKGKDLSGFIKRSIDLIEK